MSEHDPGDEDRQELDGRDCPFCNATMRSSSNRHRPWATPVMRYRPMRASFEAALLNPNERWDGEIVYSCVSCKGLARNFAEGQRMSPDEKRNRAYCAEMMRRAGVQP